MSVHIPISRSIAIGSDTYQWIIKRAAKDKAGNKVWRPESYYTTLEQAVRALLDAALRDSAAQSVGELRVALDNAVSRLKQSLSPTQYRVTVEGPRPEGDPPVNASQVGRIPVEPGPMSGRNAA